VELQTICEKDALHPNNWIFHLKLVLTQWH